MGLAIAALVIAPLAALGVIRSGGDEDPGPGPTVAATTPAPTPGTPAPTPGQTATPAPGSALDDLLDELGDLGDLGDLEDLGVPDADLAACLTPPGVTPGLQGTPIPDDPADAIAAISDQVAEVRGLEFDDPVELQLLSDDELSERVVTVTEEDWPEDVSSLDDAIYTTLRQMAPDQDLRQVTFDLLGEQVAGFYDPETGELVAESGGDMAPDEQVIIAHELDHALTDQVLGLPDYEGMEADTDALIARQGLTEGDATATMQQWAVANLGLMDLVQLGTTPVDTTQLEAAPHVLQRQLLAPYEDGLEFVCTLYLQGGWAAVDAAYANLPTTSAQVLFPQRYLDGEGAVQVATVTHQDDAWELVRETTWGAADLLWLLEAPGDDVAAGLPESEALAADWAGGRQTTWQRDGQTVVNLELVQRPDGNLCTTMQAWAAAAFPEATMVQGDQVTTTWEAPGTAGLVDCRDDVVQVTIGPDPQAAGGTTR